MVFWKNGIKGVRCKTCGPHPSDDNKFGDFFSKQEAALKAALAAAQAKANEEAARNQQEMMRKMMGAYNGSDGSSQSQQYQYQGSTYGYQTTEDDDLKKAKPNTLKIGHRIMKCNDGFNSYTGRGLHHKECECPECKGMSFLYGTVASPLKVFNGVRLPFFDIGSCMGYTVMLTYSYAGGLVNRAMDVPIYLISADYTRGATAFMIQAGAPHGMDGGEAMEWYKVTWANDGVTLFNLVADDNNQAPVIYDKLLVATPKAKFIEDYTAYVDAFVGGEYCLDNAYIIHGDSIERIAGSEAASDGKATEDCAFVAAGHALARPCNNPVKVKVLSRYGSAAAHVELISATGEKITTGSLLMTPHKLLAMYGKAFTSLPPSVEAEKRSRTESVPTTKKQEDMQLPPTQGSNIDLSGAAATLIAALQASAVPEEKVRQIVLETVSAELSKLPPKRHKIKFNENSEVEFEGTMHVMATEIMEAILAGFHNIMIVGPAGSGKTYLFSQVATLLKKQMKWDESDFMASMSCAPGQTESMFIGRMIPSLTTGLESYHGTNLTRLYAKENGGAFLFDEISNSEPTVMNLVNSMIALDGHVTLPDGRVLVRPANMVVFAADNTWGQGGDRMYIRNQLDAATLDRFTGAKFFMDYDTKLESSLCPEREVYDAVLGLRKRVGELKLRRIVSTRAFAAAQRMSANGTKVKDILKRLTIDWSENDRKSVGV
jgi:MoxR-like ATPase